MMNIVKVNLPSNTLVSRHFSTIDFADGFQAPVSTQGKLTKEDIVKAFFQSSPGWIKVLMQIRNFLASLVGLKTGKTKEVTSITLKKGQLTGLFHIYDVAENEVLLGENDKHLDFRVSFIKEKLTHSKHLLTICTIVQIHGALGRVYWLFVKPFHKRIVPVILRNMIKGLEAKC
ncbi:DUF2867 domain-containing protein [Rapidithrix thailandica]|uniref:DUF2867 domain-containing protein n=1 Tax=Rapidithrix thailandica TaxID=413964 RepID=A0AAW9S7L2_9BACT